jgi:hypothetical protein
MMTQAALSILFHQPMAQQCAFVVIHVKVSPYAINCDLV